jgi:DNA-binding MarR family transcriptional regulator
MAIPAPSIPPVALHAWRMFLTAHARVIDHLSDELEGRIGLPLGWYEVLLYLREAPGGRLRMHELAESLLLSRSAVTRFVDRMVAAGLVRRATCDTDRRGVVVEATERGHEVFRAAAPVHLEGIARHFTDHLSDDEAAVLAAALERIAASAAAPASDTPARG